MKTAALLLMPLALFVDCSAKDRIIIRVGDCRISDQNSMRKRIEGKDLLDSINVCLESNYLMDAGEFIQRTFQQSQYYHLAPKLKGELFYRRNQLDSAGYYFNNALEINRVSKDSILMQAINGFLGFTYYEMKDYGRAAEYFYKSGSGNKFFADFLLSFKGVKPYTIKSESDNKAVKIEDLDPFLKIGVTVNGKHSKNFIVDTGASIPVLSRSLAKKCGVRPFIAWNPNIKIKSKNYAIETADRMLAVLDSMQLGNYKIYNLPVLILDDKKMSFRVFGFTLYRLEGAIGLPILKNFAVTVDYPKRTILFELPDAKRRSTQETELFIYQNQPFVHLAIDTLSDFNFFIDSGAQRSTILKTTLAYMDSQSICLKKPRETDVKHVDLKLKLLNDYYPKQISVCGFQVSSFPFAVTEINFESERKVISHGIIAQDFLRNFIVRYDFPNRVFELLKPDDERRKP
jgi:hypothetical protein